jgi:hypothetical protein
MALSNAERQKRYRERAAAALRNAPAATPAPPEAERGIQTIPAALARFYAASMPSEDIAHTVAQDVAQMWAALELTIYPEEILYPHSELVPIIDALGGREYFEAALAWQRKPKSRKRDKGPAPVPPNPPVT